MKLQGKNILIVGASQGIGAELARQLAAKQNRLMIVARRLEKLQTIAQEIIEAGGQCECLQADALDLHRAEQVVDETRKQFGRIDIAILNVGGSKPHYSHQLSAEEINNYMDLNYNSLINYFVPLVRQMKADKGGLLVHTNSLGGFNAMPLMSHYAGAKAACRLFLETARQELRADNIRISILCPGFVDSPAQEDNPNEVPFMMSEEVAARKMVRAIAREKKLYLFPFPLAFGTRLLAILPQFIKNPIYQRILKNTRSK